MSEITGVVEELAHETCPICDGVMWFLEKPKEIPKMCAGCEKAFAAGAQKMREMAAKEIDKWDQPGLAGIIRSLPLPEVDNG